MSRGRTVLRALVSLVLLGGLGGAGALTGVTAPATAAESSTLLCSGYTRCAHAGLSSSGYVTAGKKMYWRMFAGHNCTNYVAYRMVRSGLPNVRPWSGGGNAMYWGTANRGRTNAVPKVGAVAWWRAHARPAGSVGHVAYVERVVSPRVIVVSQDSWGGDFSWRRISRGSGSWPSGFVHLHDVPLANRTRPRVTGTARVGQVLRATPGSWSVGGTAIRYQWLADGSAVRGATGRTFTPGRAQQGRRVSVRVTASRLGYPSTSAPSARTAPLAAARISHTGPPTVTGSPQVGVELSAEPGDWAPAPVTLGYRWAADGAVIAGADGPRFTPGPTQVGRRLTVTVTGTRSGYAAASATSSATTAVLPGVITPTARSTWTGTPRLGSRLRLAAGRFVPTATGVRHQWLRADRAVPGATGPTYTVGRADLGKRIRVRTTATRRGYAAVTTLSAATSRVRTAPVVRLTARPGDGRVTLTVRVTARGVPRVAGRVRISIAGRPARDRTLHAGIARTTFTGLRGGSRTVRARYLTSTAVAGRAVARTTHVR
jgi:surface antigen